MFRVSFVVDDKKLGDAKRALALVGVRDVTDVPMLNAEPAPDGGIRARSGSAGEALVREMARRKVDRASVDDLRAMTKAIGFSPTSYYHVLAQALKAGLIHKGEKNGVGYIYVITKRLPRPKQSHKKEK